VLDTIEQLKDSYGTAVIVSAAAGALGMAFGWLAERSSFCLRAAVAEWSPRPDTGPAHRPKTVQYLAALVLGIVLVQVTASLGIIDLGASTYHTSPLRPLALVAGGIAFGAGMVLAGGCVARLLVLAGSGNLRAWFTLMVIAISAYATMRGILSYPRTAIESALTIDTAWQPLAAGYAALAAALVLITGLFVLFASKGLRRDATPAGLATGAAVAGLILGGWLITGSIGHDDFEPTALASLSFTAPVAETVQFLMIFTGDSMRFGIALTAGVLAGALISSALAGRLQLRGFQGEADPLRYALGGLLMGFGGVTAAGCSIGQGLSGTSTLSPGSFLALAAIVGGARAAMAARAIYANRTRPTAWAADMSEPRPAG
jgi:uncharacterized membrane protein YedE/YeeE